MIETNGESWNIIGHPGYLGSKKDQRIVEWNQEYGEGNWKIAFLFANREIWDFNAIFSRIYVPGYTKYFLNHPEEGKWLTDNFAYGYDEDLISKKEAFDPNALYEKPGKANQFHHVSLNLALEYFLGMPFRGQEPIQIRAGKPGTDKNNWPKGWKWSPGYIPTVRPELIPDVEVGRCFWENDTIEELYQKSKILLVKSSAIS